MLSLLLEGDGGPLEKTEKGQQNQESTSSLTASLLEEQGRPFCQVIDECSLLEAEARYKGERCGGSRGRDGIDRESPVFSRRASRRPHADHCH